MTIPEVLAAVREHGAALTVEGDALDVVAAEPLPDALIAELREHKAHLLPLLKRESAPVSHYSHHSQNATTAVVERTAVDVDMLKDHLAILYRDIREGCRLGLHRHVERVPAEIVRSIIAAAGPETDPETFHVLCARAGEAALLASTIDEYRERMRLLVEMGEDVMRYATALELCLCHPVESGAR